jgi:membrane-associated phospholipid phosphatase
MLPPPLFLASAAAAVHAICAALVAAFVAACCVPALHAPARAAVGPWARHHVEGGVAWVRWAQRHETRALTALAGATSHSVSVPFYGAFLPAVIWLGLPELGWRLVLLMALCLYVGNAMKDLACAPRPRGVAYGATRVRLLGPAGADAVANAAEYGAPSSHTMNALCLCFYSVHYAHAGALVGDAAAAAAYAAAAAWVLWVAATRLYLGLHAPLDVLAGATAGLTVVSCFLGVERGAGALLALGPRGAPAAAAAVATVLLRLHPRPLRHTPTFEFSTAFLGVALGAVAAAARRPDLLAPPVRLAAAAAGGAPWAARRLGAGFAAVLAARAAARAVARAALPPLYAAVPLALRRAWQPPVHDRGPGRPPAVLAGLPRAPGGGAADVEATARFLTYAAIGWAACEGAPRLFEAWGL